MPLVRRGPTNHARDGQTLLQPRHGWQPMVDQLHAHDCCHLLQPCILDSHNEAKVRQSMVGNAETGRQLRKAEEMHAGAETAAPVAGSLRSSTLSR